MKRLLVSLVVIAGIAGGVFYFYKSPAAKPADQVQLGTVKRQDLSQRVNISGAVTPQRMMLFVPPYEGYVRKIYVTLGEKVKAGQPVVKITSGADDDAFPLRAPFDGVVVQVMRSEGEYVEKSKSNTLVRIDDISQLYVESDAPEMDFVKLKVGQEVIIKASAIMSRSYKGEIMEISQASRDQERWERSKVEFPIKVKILDQDAQLKPGMSVVLDVITEQANSVLTLRHEFIHKEGDKFFVIMADGQRRDIKVGLRNEEAFEVTEGVKEGDQVKPVDFATL